MITKAFKVFTHDLRAPRRGGDPIFDGRVPYQLPIVTVDSSAAECAAGWNASRELPDALRIAGLWRDGRPARAFEVETDAAVMERGDKLRAATWTITRELGEPEIVDGIRIMSEPFGDLRDAITEEQRLWRVALARPGKDAAEVERLLRAALETRGLDWSIRRFESAGAARAARAAWASGASGAVWDAWDAWAARAARAAWASGASGASGAVWDAWDAWAARGAMATMAAMAAMAARDALTVWCAAQRGWDNCSPDLLTTGLREAYRCGLGLAVPTSPRELGWAMAMGGDGG